MSILRRFRTPQVYLMLGEAYLRIQEPGKAIAAFQEALKVGHRRHLVLSMSCPSISLTWLPVFFFCPYSCFPKRSLSTLLAWLTESREAINAWFAGCQLVYLHFVCFSAAASCRPCCSYFRKDNLHKQKTTQAIVFF